MTLYRETFDGAAGTLWKDLSQWDVSGNAAMVAGSYIDGAGNLVIKEEYGSALTGMFKPALVGTTFLTRWQHPRLFPGPASWDRCRLYIWEGRVQVFYQPANNRFVVERAGSNEFVQLPAGQHFTVAGSDFTAGPTEFTTEARVAMEGGAPILRLFVNGEECPTTADLSIVPVADRTGRCGLWFEKLESWNPVRTFARDFQVDDMQGSTPTPPGTPAPSPAPTVSRPALEPFTPEHPTGDRRIRVTLATTGTPVDGDYQLLGPNNAVVRDWTAGANQAVQGQNLSIDIDLPPGRSDTDHWRVRFRARFASGETIEAPGYSRTAVGPLVGVGGQSVAGGWWQRERLDGAPAITNESYTLQNIDEGDTWRWRGIGAVPGRVSVLADLAAAIARRINRPVGMFTWGRFGASITQQMPGAVGWEGAANTPTGLKYQVARMGGYWAQATIWQQASNEAAGNDGQGGIDTYPGNFTTLHDALRTSSGYATHPISIVTLGRYANDTPPVDGRSQAATNTFWNNMRAVLSKLHLSGSNRQPGPSEFGAGPRDTSDPYHLSKENYAELVGRFARAGARLLGVAAEDPRGPMVTSAAPDGGDLLVTFGLNGAQSIPAVSGVESFLTSTEDPPVNWTAVPPGSASVAAGTNRLRLTGRAGAKWLRSHFGYNPADAVMVRGLYANGDTIPALAIMEPMAVTSTPAPTPPPTTPTPTPPPSGRGTITASAARTVRFKEVQPATARRAGVPFGAETWTAALDPHAKRRYAADFADVLGEGVEIAEILAVRISPAAFLAGLRITEDRLPIIGTDGTAVENGFEVVAARQDDAAFNGAGIEADVTYQLRLTNADIVENTAILPLRNQ